MKLNAIQISVSISKVLLEYNHTWLFMHWLGLLSTSVQRQNVMKSWKHLLSGLLQKERTEPKLAE